LFLLFVQILRVFGQSDANVGNTQPGAVASETGSPNSNLLQSELSSAALTPNLFVDSAGNWAPFIVDVYTPVFANQTHAPISWQGAWPANWTPTTCTWILSSVPPGPPTPISMSTAMVVDSLTGVVPNVSPYKNWFPAGGPVSTLTSVILTATGAWYTDTSNASNVKAGEYPTLQWSPATVTLIYQ